MDELMSQNEEGLSMPEEETMSFEDLGLDEITLAAIEKKGFVQPSPIQVLAIPRLLNGEANVIARARTGTGKTAAFGLPLVQSLRGEGDCVRAIILEPTRELAMQTAQEMASFTTGVYPRTAVVYGGASMGEQIRALRRGVEIVVGTPGRVQDLMERGVLDISKIEYFILDEGDEMLDMGFVDDIENIFASANPDCRVLLFSATIPQPILKIAGKFMGDYEIVEEEGHEEEPLLIEQKYWVVRESDKIEALVRLVDISDDFYGIVFVQKKTDADAVCKALDEKGYQVAALHGDIPQNQREKIIYRFKAKRVRILVATDVAARGIDIGGLTHVVNYDLPFDGPTYVHRIGRTGRAGAAGMAVTFVRPEEARRKLNFLRSAIKRSAKGEMTEGKVPSIEEVLAAKRMRLFDMVKDKLGLKPVADAPLESEKNAGSVKNAAAGDGVAEVSEESSSGTGANMEAVDFVAGNADVSDAAERADAAGSESGEAAVDSGEAGASASQTAKVPHLRKGDPIFAQLAEELCMGQDAQEVVASLLAATYGRELSKSRYGKITAVAGGRDRGRDRGDRGERFGRGGRDRGDGGMVSVSRNQLRLYVQMGWRDGYNPKRIAMFFASLLKLRDRDVDAIDMADRFCLLSLPKDAAERALEMSRNDSSLPHMHLDSKSVSDGSSVRGRDESFGRGGRGGRRDWDRGFGRGDFGREGRFDREERSSFRGGRAKGGSHSRPNVHTATQRSGGGMAALYKKGGSEEY